MGALDRLTVRQQVGLLGLLCLLIGGAAAVGRNVLLTAGGPLQGEPDERAIPRLPPVALPVDETGRPALATDLAPHPRFGAALSASRLLVRIARSATVQQANDAIRIVNGRLVASTGCEELTCLETGETLIIDENARGVTCGSTIIAGASAHIGTVLLEVPDLDDANDRLWDHEAVAWVAYVTAQGTAMSRLPMKSSSRANAAVPSIYRSTSGAPPRDGPFGKVESRTVLATFGREVTVAEANAVLASHDALMLSMMAGIFVLHLPADVVTAEGEPSAAVQALRSAAGVESAALNAEMKPPRLPGQPAPPPRPAPAATRKVVSTRPIACPKVEIPAGEVGVRELKHQSVRTGQPRGLHEGFVAQREEDKDRWPPTGAVFRARIPVAEGKTQAVFSACTDAGGRLEVKRATAAGKTATVTLGGLAKRGSGPAISVELDGVFDRVIFQDPSGRVLVDAPATTPTGVALVERQRADRGPRYEVLATQETARASYGAWLAHDAERVQQLWRALGAQGAAPRQVPAHGSVAFVTAPPRHRFQRLHGSCDDVTVALEQDRRGRVDHPQLFVVMVPGKPSRVQVGHQRDYVVPRFRKVLAEGKWDGPLP